MIVKLAAQKLRSLLRPSVRLDGKRGRWTIRSAAMLIALFVIAGGTMHAAAAVGPALPEPSAGEPSAAVAALSAHEHGGHTSGGVAAADGRLTLLAASKLVYYVALLAAAGFQLLAAAVPRGAEGAVRRERIGRWSAAAVKGLLLAALAYIFLHANDLVSQLGGDIGQWPRVFAMTDAGRSWLALLALAALGFAALRLPEPLGAVWALLLLASESFNGHAFAAAQASVAVVADFVHLVCSAIWAGGVILLLLFWRYDRKECGRFAESFARFAWLAIIGLAASGIVMAWTILPSWTYLLYTAWGKWLLAKSALVLAVAALGAVLRSRARRRELPRGALLKLDGVLMAAIVASAAVMTSLAPAPGGEPLRLHEMGEQLHYTLAIEPNAPGPNDITLTVWLPQSSGEPADVRLRLLPAEGRRGKPVEVELVRQDNEKEYEFPGFVETNYRSAKPAALPYPGKWTAELIVRETSGDAMEKTVSFETN